MHTIPGDSDMSHPELIDQLVHDSYITLALIPVLEEDVDVPGVVVVLGVFFACVPAVSDEHCFGHIDEIDELNLVSVCLNG